MTIRAMEGKGGARPARRLSASAKRGVKATQSGGPLTAAKQDGVEEQRLRFKKRESMKNPNWRDRHLSSPSSGTDVNSLDSSYHNIHSARGQTSSSSLEATCAKVETRVTGYPNITEVAEAGKRPPRDRQSSSTTISDTSSISDLINFSFDGDSNAAYEVISQKDLDISPTTKPVPVVFEIKPFGGTRHPEMSKSSVLPPGFARIERMSAYQADAFKKSAKAGHAGRTDLINSIYKQVSAGTSSNSSTRNRSGVLRSTMHDTSRERVKNNTPTRSEDISDAAIEERRQAALGAKHAAFQRLLERLKKSAPVKEPSQEMKEIGCARITASDGTRDWRRSFTRSSDRPSVGMPAAQPHRARWDNMVSDFEVNYRHYPQPVTRRERSESSANTDGDSELNPKAREFCSFKSAELASIALVKEQSTFSPSDAPLKVTRPKEPVKEPVKEPGCPSNPAPAPVQAPLSSGVPPPQGAPQVPLGGYSMPDLQRLTNLLPWMGINQNAMGLANNMMPDFSRPVTHVPLPQLMPGLAGGFGGPLPSMVNLPMPQVAPGYHSLPARLHYPVPLQTPILPSPALPVPTAPQPFPVAKPKVPHTGNQQAYEAYIEQRKAMDPGYAMECRLRQQRRAKRGMNRAVTQMAS